MSAADARPGTGASPARWPASAIVAVAACCIAIVLLALVNVLAVPIAGNGYNPDVGGTVADWFAAAATAIAVPAAMLIGIRQIGAQNAANEMAHRQHAVERDDRMRQQHAEHALALDAVEVRLDVTNAADSVQLASEPEQVAVQQWREELTRRGWESENGDVAWRRDGMTRTNADHLSTERSPLLRDPWWIVVDCRNDGPVTVIVERWTITVNHSSSHVHDPIEIRTGGSLTRRLGPEHGVAAGFPTAARARSAAAGVTVELDGRDILGRRLHIRVATGAGR